MNNSVTAPTVGQALAWAFQRLREEWRTVLILGVVFTVIYLVVQSLMFDYYIESFAQYGEIFRLYREGNLDLEHLNSLNQIEYSSGVLIFSMLVNFVVAFCVYVLLSRLADMDRSHLLDGGFAALGKRALWAFWRYICALGWIMLLLLAVSLILIVLGVLLSVLGSGALILDFIPVIIYGVTFVVLIIVINLLTIAIYASSRDIRIGILATWRGLKGVRSRFVLTMIVITIIFLLVFVPFFVGLVLLQPHNVLVWITYYSLTGLLGTFATFLWLAVGAAFAPYALRNRMAEANTPV